jgi:NTE family protein
VVAKKVALVLSGGGAKGGFQAGAERYAREVMGYEWNVIAGVSVGALNTGMLAMRKYEELWELWATISNDKVFTGRMSVLYALWRIVTFHKSVLGNGPLRRLIEREFDAERIRKSGIELRVGAVSLRTGEYVPFKPDEVGAEEFKAVALASTAIPVYWAPEEVGQHGPMVDGGVRNVTPIGDVLDTSPDEVVIMNCNPETPRALDEPPGDIFDIATRSLEIAVNEIFVGDVREFRRINSLVQQAASKGVTLTDDDGNPYKYIECHVIEPKEHLGGTVDFSRETVQASMKEGWEAAAAVLGGPDGGPPPAFPALPGE